jgi:hypothetical protein
MKKWRIVKNKWNLDGAPWRGGFGIEEIDEDLAVPALVCWFYRGHDRKVAQRVVDLHNEWIDSHGHDEP